MRRRPSGLYTAITRPPCHEDFTEGRSSRLADSWLLTPDSFTSSPPSPDTALDQFLFQSVESSGGHCRAQVIRFR